MSRARAARERVALAFVALVLSGCALTGGGGRAANVEPRVPEHVIGDHSRRPMPDPIDHALDRWLAATSDARTRGADWGASDEPGAAELRGVALGRGARAAVARFALRTIRAVHRAMSAGSDTVALEALIELGNTRIARDPGFAAQACLLSLELASDALAASDPGDDDAWWLDDLADTIDAHIDRVRATASASSRIEPPQIDRAAERARTAARRWLEVRGLAPPPVDQG